MYRRSLQDFNEFRKNQHRYRLNWSFRENMEIENTKLFTGVAKKIARRLTFLIEMNFENYKQN